MPNALRGIPSAEVPSRSKTDLTSRLQLLASIVTYILYVCIPLGWRSGNTVVRWTERFIAEKTVAWLGL